MGLFMKDLPRSDLRNLLHKMQLIGSFLSGCVLRMREKVNEFNAFYAARLNKPKLLST